LIPPEFKDDPYFKLLLNAAKAEKVEKIDLKT
jgi:hypothetical protein